MDSQQRQIRFYSRTSGTQYKMTLSKDQQVVYCSCPAWRFQSTSPANRTCKHIKALTRMALTTEIKDGMVL